MKKICFFSVVSLLLIGAVQAQTTVTITRQSGASYSYTVQTSGSITFNGNYVKIKESATSDETAFDMGTIRKMTFSDGGNGIEQVIGGQQASVRLYPNPAQDYCVVRSSDEGLLKVTVFSMTGAKMIETTVENEGRMDISNLKSGVYMVKVNNTTTKLCKW